MREKEICINIVYAEGWNILIGGLQANQGVAKVAKPADDSTYYIVYVHILSSAIW